MSVIWLVYPNAGMQIQVSNPCLCSDPTEGPEPAGLWTGITYLNGNLLLLAMGIHFWIAVFHRALLLFFPLLYTFIATAQPNLVVGKCAKLYNDCNTVSVTLNLLFVTHSFPRFHSIVLAFRSSFNSFSSLSRSLSRSLSSLSRRSEKASSTTTAWTTHEQHISVHHSTAHESFHLRG